MKKITYLILVAVIFNTSLLLGQMSEMSKEYLMIQSLKDPSLAPLTYTLGSGDRIYLNLWGNTNADYRITVSQDGNIFIPKKTTPQVPVQGYGVMTATETVPALGEIKAEGLTINELKEKIEERVKRYFRGVNVRVSLSGLRTFPVSILGNVIDPGVYSITPLYRLSNLVEIAGGILGTGTYRNIKIKKPSTQLISIYPYIKLFVYV